ncbi:C2 domain-containing protein 5-like isoform X2 [Rhopilema esculentum]|uniref:C2 domain-containing protein 5-like isoform X2 n=1 Tax=Rhopilema esculentum TaxID=499914 RepID=UPI0031E3FB6C
MPGIIKVRLLGARDLPVMDRASDLTDAFVEVRHGTTIHRTDVCRKSLNPTWNSEWLRFEADDEQLQDEPLQVKVLDYDMYSAHDTIGKVMIGLSSLILRNGTNEMRGWFPIYDTLHGIRGYIQIFVKVEFFVDANKYRQTSCGIRFFATPAVPSGYTAIAVQGFVDVLVVNDDPEYQWIDKIRTPRASNDARIRLFSKLSGEVNRRLGLKVIEAGGNAVIGYCQCFDIEGDTGIVVRAIGTSVTLMKQEDDYSAIGSLTNSPDISSNPLTLGNVSTDPFQLKCPRDKSQKLILHRQSTKSRTASGRYGRTISTSSDGNDTINEASMLLNSSGDSIDNSHIQDFLMVNLANTGQKVKSLEEIEFPFFTITKLPTGFVLHVGGVVSSKSVKLLDKINNPDDPETREAWWNEIRTEIRSHAKALACHAVIGYTEYTTICDDLVILSAYGTAAIVRLPNTPPSIEPELLEPTDFQGIKINGRKLSEGEDDEEETVLKFERFNSIGKHNSARTGSFDCRVCHIAFGEVDLPYSVNVSKCMICRQGKVPDVIFATIEPPSEVHITGNGSLLQARVYRTKKREKDEVNADNVSQILPFLEYELHRQMLNKLKVKGLNAIFGLKMQVSVGENLIIGLMTGTAVYLTALPPPPLFLVSGSKGDAYDEKKLLDIQKKIIDETSKNRARMHLPDSLEMFGTKTPPNTPVFNIGGSGLPNEMLPIREDVQGTLDLAHGVKEAYVVTVDDTVQDDILSTLTDSFQVEGGYAFSTEATPGISHEAGNDVQVSHQFLTMFHWRKLSEDDLKINTIFPKICEDLILAMHFKLRNRKPYQLSRITYNIKIPEDNDIQVLVTALALKQESRKPTESTRISRAVHGSLESDDLMFPLDVPDCSQQGEGMQAKQKGSKLREAPLPDLSQTWPNNQLTDVKTLLFIHGVKHHDMYSEHIVISPSSDVPDMQIQQFLGYLNLFFIRETTSVKEDGGLNMFMQNFIAEVHAIVRAQVAALAGDGIVSFSINDVTLLDSSHKNQSQCLLNASGDVVRFSLKNEEEVFGEIQVSST